MITLKETLNILIKDHNFREISFKNDFLYTWKDNPSFEKLSYNSQDISKKTLFFAKGLTFKKEYLEKAISQGCPFYISEVDYHLDIPAILVNNIKAAMSLIAMAFYDNPQEKLKIIGFTGTKGKTTSAYFAFNILSQNHKVAMLSTMNTTLDGGKSYFKSKLTTPESLDLYAMMATAVENDCTYLIMEVSSQAYFTQRVYGLTFDVGIFLNISPDHISPIEHPTFEDYFYHKRQLIKHSKHIIVNSQMDYFPLLKEEVKTISHDFYGEFSNNRIITSNEHSFEVTGTLRGLYKIALIGDFNQENALAAGLASSHLGISKEDIKKGISETTVPGRMEILQQNNGAKIFIDYAHNGDSLNKLLQVVKKHQPGKLILVIGSTGNKGKSRRKDFATVINKYQNITTILTSDDPNYEKPADICQEIQSYINRPSKIVIDRQEAIKYALQLTNTKEDAVILAGKGADAFQIIKGEYQHYPGDKETVLQYL